MSQSLVNGTKIIIPTMPTKEILITDIISKFDNIEKFLKPLPADAILSEEDHIEIMAEHLFRSDIYFLNDLKTLVFRFMYYLVFYDIHKNDIVSRYNIGHPFSMILTPDHNKIIIYEHNFECGSSKKCRHHNFKIFNRENNSVTLLQDNIDIFEQNQVTVNNHTITLGGLSYSLNNGTRS